MKTLVIHPKDITTDFLSVVYSDINCTLIRNNLSHAELKKSIKDHDRIIFLGHGTEYGLIGFGKILIGSELVYLLREKKNNIYIWCNADKFVKKYELNGFVTGMIISEYEEAIDYNIHCNYENIEVSNEIFAFCLKESIKYDPPKMLEKMSNDYGGHISSNNVMEFNSKNLFCY